MKNLITSHILLLASFCVASCLASCGHGTDNPLDLDQSDLISECGGFEAGGHPILGAPPAYCDAEVLHWEYEEDTTTLKLADTRIQLNCCGEHSMEVVYDAGVYVVTETDAPDNGDRCKCVCVFDFTVTVSDIPAGTISIKLRRIVTDQQPEQKLVYEGELDLSAGSGFVVIDESVVNCDTI